MLITNEQRQADIPDRLKVVIRILSAVKNGDKNFAVHLFKVQSKDQGKQLGLMIYYMPNLKLESK